VTSATAYDDGLVVPVTEAKEFECSVDDGHQVCRMVAFAARFVR
jgi:hypothetical protein